MVLVVLMWLVWQGVKIQLLTFGCPTRDGSAFCKFRHITSCHIKLAIALLESYIYLTIFTNMWILLYEEANELYRNHPIKLYPTPDKPHNRSTPHLTSTTLNVPYTWKTLHSLCQTPDKLHSLCPTPDKHCICSAKPEKEENKKHLLCSMCPAPDERYSLPYTWRTLHSLCPTPNEHITLVVAPVPFLSMICSWNNGKHWPMLVTEAAVYYINLSSCKDILLYMVTHTD